MAPSIGRIVHYTLDESDATAVNRRRVRNPRAQGEQLHVGRTVTAGDTFPAMCVRAEPLQWIDDGAIVQGRDAPSLGLQVYLDGNDVLWVPEARQDEHGTHGTWDWPPRI